MIIHRKLTLQASVTSVTKKLETQIRHLSPRGFVKGSCFKLYKAIAKSSNRFFLLVLIGQVREKDYEIEIDYYIRPTLLAMVVALALFLPMLEGIIYMFRGVDNIIFLLLGIAINTYFHILIHWQEKICMDRFESFLEKEFST